MEASEQKLLADYLLKTGRIKTLEVLRSEWIPEKRTKLSFSIETAPRRKQIEINKPRASTSKSLISKVFSFSFFFSNIISFNSTMAIDCVLRDVPYVQYAMGTFWNAFGVYYSNYQLPTEVEPISGADKLADFLIHKYCYYKNIGISKQT